MHWLHDRENDFPISLPCCRAVHISGFFQCHRNIYQIAGIKKYVHRHIEYHIKDDHANPVRKPETRSLFYQRHHQDCEGYEHTADDVEICKIIKFAVSFISTNRVSDEGVDHNGDHNRQYSDQDTVK